MQTMYMEEHYSSESVGGQTLSTFTLYLPYSIKFKVLAGIFLC